MSRFLLLMTLTVLLCFIGVGSSAASGYKTIDTASPQEIVDGMATKGVRGAANILTGWVELPKQIYLTGEKDGWLRGSVIGPLKGIGMTVARTASGVGELLTFFVAYPGFFDPWIEPRFVWMKE